MLAAGDGHYGVVPSLQELVGLRERVSRATPGTARFSAPGAGTHVSARHGRGLEFAEARPYQPGDDIRALDWRQTARRGRPYTKVFHEEREQPVLLLVDLGPSMRFGTRVAFKSVVAARAAACIAWSAADAGDRVGGVVWDGLRPHEVRPQSRERGVLELVRHLSAESAPEASDAEGLAKALNALGRIVRPGSRIVLISDFLTLAPAAERAAAALGCRAQLALVQVYDGFESDPPPGRYRLTDGRHSRTLDLSDPAARARYRAPFHERRAALQALARRARAPLALLATHEDPWSVLPLLRRERR